MDLISAKKLVFEYVRRDKNGEVDGFMRAIDEVDLDVKQGDLIAILGPNGSGKSTFAKHLNSLLHPTEGVVYVDGNDTADADKIWDIRKAVGMVFQNPENQMIGTIVEEDVAFAPENLGISPESIKERVKESLDTVEMYSYRKSSPSKLSGGQKQRVAIAGVLAMHPKCIVLDEPTAMLDPIGRKEVIRAIRALNDVENITVILITHNMEEAVYADRIYVMDSGKIVMDGTPREVFSRVEELEQHRLSVPQVTRLAYELRKAGLNIPQGILTRKELCEALCR
ncbi:MAG: energy-coupling factor transporter ATPase [Lachnospiraceae bacterium]|jgi:energy-coupling factor transport system ATP-binding protein|nr:energy-coupling factor transporter ATPase [Lachnospiraceae bacterium]